MLSGQIRWQADCPAVRTKAFNRRDRRARRETIGIQSARELSAFSAVKSSFRGCKLLQYWAGYRADSGVV